VLHADETPVAQLDPGKGKTRKAYLWAYRSNDLEPGPRIIVFDYQVGRSGRHAQSFLEDWRGHLLVDDYGGYKALFSGKQATHAPNWLLGARTPQILRFAQGQRQSVGFCSVATHWQTYTPPKPKARPDRSKPASNYEQKKACRSCNHCTTGYCKPAPKPPMAAAPPKPSTTP
jgi:hypothetical protein